MVRHFCCIHKNIMSATAIYLTIYMFLASCEGRAVWSFVADTSNMSIVLYFSSISRCVTILINSSSDSVISSRIDKAKRLACINPACIIDEPQIDFNFSCSPRKCDLIFAQVLFPVGSLFQFANPCSKFRVFWMSCKAKSTFCCSVYGRLACVANVTSFSIGF